MCLASGLTPQGVEHLPDERLSHHPVVKCGKTWVGNLLRPSRQPSMLVHRHRLALFLSFLWSLSDLETLGLQCTGGWLNQHRTIGENNCRHAAHPAIDLHHRGGSLLVAIIVDSVIESAMRIEPAPIALAIPAPACRVHDERICAHKQRNDHLSAAHGSE